MKFRQVKKKENYNKLCYDVAYKASCGTLCLILYGIFLYSLSSVSLVTCFWSRGTHSSVFLWANSNCSNLLKFLQNWNTHTEMPSIFVCPSGFMTEFRPASCCFWHSKYCVPLQTIARLFSVLIWRWLLLNSLPKNSCSVKLYEEYSDPSYLAEEAIPHGNKYCRWNCFNTNGPKFTKRI